MANVSGLSLCRNHEVVGFAGVGLLTQPTRIPYSDYLTVQQGRLPVKANRILITIDESSTALHPKDKHPDVINRQEILRNILRIISGISNTS